MLKKGSIEKATQLLFSTSFEAIKPWNRKEWSKDVKLRNTKKRDVHKRPVCNEGWRYGCFGREDSKGGSSDNLWRNAVTKASYGCLLEHFIVYDITRFNLILHIWYLYWCIIDMHFAWDSGLIFCNHAKQQLRRFSPSISGHLQQPSGSLKSGSRRMCSTTLTCWFSADSSTMWT